MLRKGALESGLGEIMLTVLVAAVISGAMFGPLGAKVGEGFREAEKFTDITTTVEVEDSDVFGSLSKYVFWRAWGCNKVESETFSGLTDTSLTDTGQMPCASAGGTVAASGRNLYANTGGDMEGKYGRINFVINDSFTLRTGDAFGPDGREAILLGISDGSRGKQGYSDWIRSGCTAYDPGVWRDWGGSWESKGPPYSFFTLFFKNGGGSSRVSTDGSGRTLEGIYYDENHQQGLYCYPLPTNAHRLTKPQEWNGFPSNNVDNYQTTGGDHAEVRLCEGDKGYIEVRKGYPNIEGESTGNVASDNNDNLYGMIQITNMNESC